MTADPSEHDGSRGLEQRLRLSEDRGEAVEAERALRDSQRLLQSVVTSAPVIVFALDAEGRFTLSEGRGLELAGLSAGQVVGISALDLYAEVPEVCAAVRRALKGESFNALAQVGPRTYRTWYSPTFDASGVVTGVVGVAADLTEQKQLEEQLQQSQKLESVGRLAGGIAHDFNNMLMAIIGYADLLSERLPDLPGVSDDLNEIKRAAERASVLTHQLLAFSRKQILRPKTLDLNEVVSDVSRMLQRLIGEDIAMVTRLGADLGAVRADPGQVAQVVMNLAVNARDAMPGGGVLTIDTSNIELDAEAAARLGLRAGQFVALSVGDTGTGMPPDVQARIFEPFFTTKPVGKGTGMGLASVYGIVRQSDGQVEVRSQVGQGSTFTVYLPRVTASATPDLEPAASAPLPHGTETILLVEDEDMVRGLIGRTLTACGYQVLEATDGVEALELCGGRRDIALVITDVVMPKMGGREMAAELERMRPDVRVLFMSGYTDTAIAKGGVLDEGAEFLQKPFAMRAVAMKVREVLDAPPKRYS